MHIQAPGVAGGREQAQGELVQTSAIAGVWRIDIEDHQLGFSRPDPQASSVWQAQAWHQEGFRCAQEARQVLRQVWFSDQWGREALQGIAFRPLDVAAAVRYPLGMGVE